MAARGEIVGGNFVFYIRRSFYLLEQLFRVKPYRTHAPTLPAVDAASYGSTADLLSQHGGNRVACFDDRLVNVKHHPAFQRGTDHHPFRSAHKPTALLKNVLKTGTDADFEHLRILDRRSAHRNIAV